MRIPLFSFLKVKCKAICKGTVYSLASAATMVDKAKDEVLFYFKELAQFTGTVTNKFTSIKAYHHALV
jgi:hypothetical protein